MEEQLITLTGKDMKKANGTDTRRELKAQKYVLSEIEKLYKKANKAADEKGTALWVDRAQILKNYVYALHGFVALLEKLEILRMSEPEGDIYHDWQAYNRRKKEREERQKRDNRDRHDKRAMLKQINSEGITLAWDMEKFRLIARDRGYQTEEAIIYAIGQEVGLNRIKAKTLYETGKFTWGQVMCLGAMLEMTPKEFCDTFLSGYFEEAFGEYRASYNNVDKSELLKKPVMNVSVESERFKKYKKEKAEKAKREKEAIIKAVEESLEQTEEPEVIEVGSDGSPVDEEWWDD